MAASPRDQIDPLSLTTEMEAISDDVKKRREVDHTLARFSAVHDELAEQERQKKERRQKLLPWKQDHDEDATVFAEPLDADDDIDDLPRRRRARTVKHSKIVRIVKVLSLTGAVLVFVATGLGWGAMQYIDSKFTEIDALNTNSAAVHEAEKQLGDENFLIVGSDTRAGARPEDGVGDADNEPGARSDVLMLAHIPADRKRVVVVSVPRDLQITRPECEKWNWETGEYTGEVLRPAKGVKANQAYADGGPRCVSTFMTELTGLTINHFISVDFNGFKGMVDAVGKIKVCVPKVMEDEELGMIFDKPGQYEIDGAKALDYVRARKVTTEPLGDYDRVKRQQKFLSSLLRTALSSEMLLNPGKLNNFLNAFASSTVGQNIGVKDMLTLAQSLQGIEAGRVSFVTVPHETQEGPTLDNHDNIEVLLEDETRALFQAIIDGTPLPGETPDATPTQSAPAPSSNAPAQPKQGQVIDPKGLKIQVFNGEQGIDGAAKRARDNLEELGFSIVNWGSSGESTARTVVRYGIGGEDAAATLAAAVPGATPEFRPEMGGSVMLLIGSDWDEKVVTPKPGGTTPQPGKATPPPVEVVNAGVDPCA
ncbi:LytR family transcriptional attenuator [Saccharothrix variisporea]|uniref:LytR family transcriptional attenuator n=1 Tax=Saccharothrix variisporea TaxID=543527 RepID=A0A495XC87_9PSEU|nr:LytR family transcriptional attenuator [Saccharothrix variisporea]